MSVQKGKDEPGERINYFGNVLARKCLVRGFSFSLRIDIVPGSTSERVLPSFNKYNRLRHGLNCVHISEKDVMCVC